MNIFTRDLGFPEAPVVSPDGSFLFVEMTPEKGCVIHVSADGASRKVIAKTGRPNGLARDRNGAIWVAETEQRALLKLDLDGSYDTVATSAGDERFLFLNDLAFAPNGELFLTDSGILHDDFMKGGQFVPNYRDLKYDGRVIASTLAQSARRFSTADSSSRTASRSVLIRRSMSRKR